MNLKYPKKPIWQKELDELLECEEGLRPHEVIFIDDLDQLRKNGKRHVTPAQRMRLKRIWDRVFLY